MEFRHQSWFAGEERQRGTLAFLRELGVAHTVVDGPQGFYNSVPALWEPTHPRYALVRLHGRNSQTWNVKGQTWPPTASTTTIPTTSSPIWCPASSGWR